MSEFIPPYATTAVRTGLTLEAGEMVYDSELKRMFVGDGETAGGNSLLTGADGYVINKKLTVNVGASRALTTLAAAFEYLKGFSLGVGVGVEILLDAGTYAGVSCADIPFCVTIKSADTNNKATVGALVFNYCNTVLDSLNFSGGVSVYCGLASILSCAFISGGQLYSDYNAAVVISYCSFNAASVFPGAAVNIQGRSHVEITNSTISNRGTGISAAEGSYVISSGNTFTNVTTNYSPTVNTVGNDNSYIKG